MIDFAYTDSIMLQAAVQLCRLWFISSFYNGFAF